MDTAQQDSFRFRDLFSPTWRYSLITALVLLVLAYVAEHFANVYELEYSLRPTSTYVGDLLLDNLPVINLNYIIVGGALLSIIFGTAFVLSKPRYVLFSLKALALFIVIRALFISLTHMGIYPGSVHPGVGFFSDIYTYLNLQMGFFFSGHTGLPILMALIFWEKLYVRRVFLSLSLIFGVAVLIAHVHYSIDVFAAPFMAYGIFKIAQRLFPRDYRLTEPLT